MNKIAFSLIISGWALQEQLGLPDNAETLHVSVEYPIDGRFNITLIKITRCTNVVKSGSSYCESFGPYLFERYVRSIKTLKDDIKGQHELVESVKSFVIQYLESLDVLSIQDGEEIVLDEGITACFKKEDSEQKPIKRVQCDCCGSAYFDFVLTDENISASPMYICTMCSDDMEKRNLEFDKGNKDVDEPFYTNQEIEIFHANFVSFKKANEIIDCGNL